MRPGDRQASEADRQWARSSAGDFAKVHRVPLAAFTRLLDRYARDGEPLPLLADHHRQDRIAAGWSADDPLTPIALNLLSRQAGFVQFNHHWLRDLREPIEATLRSVGAECCFARDGGLVERADGQGSLAWSPPLHRLQAVALVGVVRTAAAAVIAAVSGMRASGFSGTPDRLPPAGRGVRPRHDPLPARQQGHQGAAAGRDQGRMGRGRDYRLPGSSLAEQLHIDPRPGDLLFGRLAFGIRYQWFRNWVNGPAGQRLGLASIPDTQVNLRTLRRTLAIELAYRPGGVLATKIHLKHVAVATTEGYASRPGGAQAELLAEVNKHESDRNLNLVWTEFLNYQQGIMPAGPGARELTGFFAHVDAQLTPADAGTAKVQHSDREVLSLLTKRASTLHLGTANFCWFTDPSRALCLKLAGTPDAGKAARRDV